MRIGNIIRKLRYMGYISQREFNTLKEGQRAVQTLKQIKERADYWGIALEACDDVTEFEKELVKILQQDDQST